MDTLTVFACLPEFTSPVEIREIRWLYVFLQVQETVTELCFKICTKPDKESVSLLQLCISLKEYRHLSINPKAYLCVVA